MSAREKARENSIRWLPLIRASVPGRTLSQHLCRMPYAVIPCMEKLVNPSLHGHSSFNLKPTSYLTIRRTWDAIVHCYPSWTLGDLPFSVFFSLQFPISYTRNPPIQLTEQSWCLPAPSTTQSNNPSPHLLQRVCCHCYSSSMAVEPHLSRMALSRWSPSC